MPKKKRQRGCAGAGASASAGASAGAGTGADAPSEWRSKCIARWNLQEVPAAWYEGSAALTDHYEELSRADDETWKRYHAFRLKHLPKAAAASHETGDTAEDEDRYLYDDENCGLQKKADAHLERVTACNGPGGLLWAAHADCLLKDSVWEDVDDPRSCEFEGVVFSPFALPRATRLKHRYHHRSRWSSIEFYCTWDFQLVRFDGIAFGDEVQQRLAKQFPKDLMGPDIAFAHESETTGFEELCSTSVLDPPPVHDLQDADIWTFALDEKKDNLNPTTVRRFRSWLFGSACPGCKQLLSDWSLLALIFASCGSDVTRGPLIGGHTGYSWPSDFKDKARVRELLEKEGCDWAADGEIEEGDLSVSWLEYAARAAAGALRPVDAYFEPYDLLEVKAEWGRRVLQARAEMKEEDGGSEDESSAEHAAPWIVWDRAEKGSGMGGGDDMLAMLMAMQGMGGR